MSQQTARYVPPALPLESPQIEATAPVKLPTWQCPAAGSRTAVRAEVTQGWYFTVDSTDASAPAAKTPTYATHAEPQPKAKMQKSSTGSSCPSVRTPRLHGS